MLQKPIGNALIAIALVGLVNVNAIGLWAVDCEPNGTPVDNKDCIHPTNVFNHPGGCTPTTVNGVHQCDTGGCTGGTWETAANASCGEGGRVVTGAIKTCTYPSGTTNVTIQRWQLTCDNPGTMIGPPPQAICNCIKAAYAPPQTDTKEKCDCTNGTRPFG
jgi:hypothetical protein